MACDHTCPSSLPALNALGLARRVTGFGLLDCREQEATQYVTPTYHDSYHHNTGHENMGAITASSCQLFTTIMLSLLLVIIFLLRVLAVISVLASTVTTSRAMLPWSWVLLSA